MSTAYSYVINQIKKRKEIPINMIEKINIEPDYNCLFRSFSYYLYRDQEHHNEIRKDIYNHAKQTKKR